MSEVLFVVIVGGLIVASLGASTLLWRQHPSRPRVLGATFLGIASAIACWVMMASIFDVSELSTGATTALTVLLIGAGVGVASHGRKAIETQRYSPKSG